MKKLTKSEYERMEDMKTQQAPLHVVITDTADNTVTLDETFAQVIMMAVQPGVVTGMHAFQHGRSLDLYTMLHDAMEHMEGEQPDIKKAYEATKHNNTVKQLLDAITGGGEDDNEGWGDIMAKGHALGLDKMMKDMAGMAHNCDDCDHYDECTLSFKKER